MAKIIKFDSEKKKRKKKDRSPKKEIVVKESNGVKDRHGKAMNYLAWVNSQFWHKFLYPTLAFRYPKGTHSLDVLYGHCFTEFGDILKDTDKYPGIACAKKWAVERQEEILDLIQWRLRKYQEAKTLYGTDLIVIDVYIEMTERIRTHFQELFKSYGRT